MIHNKVRLVVFVLLVALTLLPQVALAADNSPVCADEVVPGVCLLRTLAPVKTQSTGTLIVGTVNFAGMGVGNSPESTYSHAVPAVARQYAGARTRMIPQ